MEMIYEQTDPNRLRIVKPIILMDICTVNYIKEIEKSGNIGDKRKIERLEQLAELVFSKKYQFSFLLAIIEKATDYRNPLTVNEMINRFQTDFRKIMVKCGVKNIVESHAFLKKLIKIIMDESFENRERAELSLENSLKFLKFYESFGIKETPKANERIVLAREVAEYGDVIGLTRGYPTIVICIASIYGCMDARGILKISADTNSFNPSNAMGDIMSFYRVAKARHLIKEKLPTAKVIFRTEDGYLERMHEYYIAKVENNDGDAPALKIDNIQPKKLFPALYKKEICINEKELHELYGLLDFKKY